MHHCSSLSLAKAINKKKKKKEGPFASSYLAWGKTAPSVRLSLPPLGLYISLHLPGLRCFPFVRYMSGFLSICSVLSLLYVRAPLPLTYLPTHAMLNSPAVPVVSFLLQFFDVTRPACGSSRWKQKAKRAFLLFSCYTVCAKLLLRNCLLSCY